MANGESTTTGTEKKTKAAQADARPLSLEQRLERKLGEVRRYRGTVRFFENRRFLLSSSDHGARAQKALRRAERRLAAAERAIATIRRALRKRERKRRAGLPPRIAICEVFGERYCGEAVSVAWCESRLVTTARNGQYLGLFQMGSYERRLFGHGDTAYDQASAARVYFLESGRDWSPWSCRWATY